MSNKKADSLPPHIGDIIPIEQCVWITIGDIGILEDVIKENAISEPQYVLTLNDNGELRPSV